MVKITDREFFDGLVHHERMQRLSPREYIIEVLRAGKKSARKFSKKRNLVMLSTFTNLVEMLQEKQNDALNTEDLAVVLAYIAVYGKLPAPREVEKIDMTETLVMFQTKYSDEILTICGPDD